MEEPTTEQPKQEPAPELVARASSQRHWADNTTMEGAPLPALPVREEEVSEVYVVRWLAPKCSDPAHERGRFYLHQTRFGAWMWETSPGTAHRSNTVEDAESALALALVEGPSPVGMMGGTLRVVRRWHCLTVAGR